MKSRKWYTFCPEVYNFQRIYADTPILSANFL